MLELITAVFRKRWVGSRTSFTAGSVQNDTHMARTFLMHIQFTFCDFLMSMKCVGYSEVHQGHRQELTLTPMDDIEFLIEGSWFSKKTHVETLREPETLQRKDPANQDSHLHFL